MQGADPDRKYQSLRSAIALGMDNLERRVNESPDEAHTITTEWIHSMRRWIDRELPNEQR
jgi:hypothetical protein